MPDWLRRALDDTKPHPPLSLLEYPEIPGVRVVLAMVAGFLAAGVYAVTFGRRRKDARSLCTTLVLLAVLVAVVIQVIGDNAARAFGLVGALSIVRFRTVVEDTADTAFVIFAVTLGMAVGAGYSVLAAMCIPAVALIAVVMNRYDRQKENGTGFSTLAVRLGLGFDPTVALKTVFDEYLVTSRLTRTETVLKGVAVEFTYAVKMKDPAAAFRMVNDLNKTEGVQGVELK
jgi:Domain of unknown function (DUF4956)